MKIISSPLVNIFNAFPLPVFVANKNLEIKYFNDAAKELFENTETPKSNKLCGKLLSCAHERRSEAGCGSTPYCKDCVIRSMVETLSTDEKKFRKISHMPLLKNGFIEDVTLLVSGKCIELENTELVILTLENITELIDIRREITICMHCKKLRKTETEWQDVEEYFYKNSNLCFTNSICPTCIESEYDHNN